LRKSTWTLVADLAHVDRDLAVRQVDHDPAFAVGAAAEVEVAQQLAPAGAAGAGGALPRPAAASTAWPRRPSLRR
jgi:hypothetical protein